MDIPVKKYWRVGRRVIKLQKFKKQLHNNNLIIGELNMPEEEGYPVEAIILINTKLGDMWRVVEEARKIEGVKFAKAAAGRYDVIAHVQTCNMSWIIARLHGINGIVRTETLITLEAKF
jgi:hypothetical protein